MKGRSLLETSAIRREDFSIVSVLHDFKLSHIAFRVFCWLALRKPSEMSVGQRHIAQSLGHHQETVSKALRELQSRGHIRIESKGRERGRYVLMAAVYHPPPVKSRKRAA